MYSNAGAKTLGPKKKNPPLAVGNFNRHTGLNGPSSMDPDYARGYQVAQAQGHLSSSSARLTVPAPVMPLRPRVDEEVAQPQSWNAENDSVLHAATAESTEMGNMTISATVTNCHVLGYGGHCYARRHPAVTLKSVQQSACSSIDLDMFCLSTGISLGAGFFVLFAAAFVFCYLQGLPMGIGGMTRIMLACFA